MISRECIILLMLVVVTVSCNPEKEVEYYPNGELKWESEIIDGKRSGLMKEYYENGELKSKGEWKYGVPNGKIEHYYRNGELKSVSLWNDGKQDGLTKKYYKEGGLKSKAVYDKGKRISIDYFDKKTRLTERQFYDSLDRLIYLAKYDTTGHKEYGFPLVLFTSKKDTVELSDTYTVVLYFGLPLKGNVRAYTGEYEEGSPELVNLVELEEIEPYVFQYIYRPKKTGSYSIPFKFEHDTDESDTLNVNGLSVKHGIHVIDDSAGV